MFVGDSITGSPGCWRPAVWTALTDAGYVVNMVGIRTENECGDVVSMLMEPWDPDHTGIGGVTTAKMWVKLAQDEVLAATDPDVIVQLLGTNDLLGGATADDVLDQYTKLLELYREHDAAISLVVAAPPPMSDGACGCAEAQQALERALPAWALSTSTPGSPVTVADLSTDFDPTTHTSDGIHPNDDGNAVLAAAWLPAISTALDVRALAPEPVPSPTPSPTSDADASGPSARSWVVLALVVLVAGAVTVVAARARTRQP
jgi:lysophospholipase L1-like esterase